MGRQCCVRFALLLSVLFTATSCTHLTSRTQRILAIGSGLSIGAVVGASRPEEKTKNALMYGSLFGVLTAVLSEIFISDTEKLEKFKQETAALKDANEQLKAQSAPKLEEQGSSLLSAPLPKDTRHLVKPGGWKRYKLDRWVQDEGNDNLWYRQTEMFEVIPPSLGSN